MNTRSSGKPSRCKTMTSWSGGSASNSASFTSEHTSCESHCAISIGPLVPAASTANAARVDHARAAHGIDVESPPREIDERDSRDQLDVDPGGADQLDAALGDRRAPGHRVHDLALLACGLDDAVGDRGVHRVEVVGGVVEEVEWFERDAVGREIGDRRVTGSADEPDRNPFERGARGGKEQVGAGRAEPDHHDARLARHLARSVRQAATGLRWWWCPRAAVLGAGGCGGTTRYWTPCEPLTARQVPNRGSMCTLNVFRIAVVAARASLCACVPSACCTCARAASYVFVACVTRIT